MIGRRRREALQKRLRKAEREARTYDPRFLALAGRVHVDDRTLLQNSRLWILWQAVRNVAPLGGAAAEVGAYRGGSAYFAAAAFRDERGEEVAFEVVDTFAGHPAERLSDIDPPKHHRAGKFTGTSASDVRAYLADFERLTVYEGAIEDVAATLPERTYSFVHLDVDIYEPMLFSLRYFGPRMIGGGVVVLDDYGSTNCPGVRRAWEEFDGERRTFQAWHPHTEQLVLIKR